jgi:transposase
MSRRPLLPNAENCSLAELEVAMKASPTQAGYKRMLAIRTVFLGYSCAEVALIHNVSRQTLSNWIKRFNQRGIDGLIDRSRSGRPRVIDSDQSSRYRALIEDPSLAGQEHWTAVKFHGYLREELGHEVGYSTVLRWLHENEFRLKVPQPWPDRQDEETRVKWLKELRLLLSDPEVELWYGDECGVEGDPRPRRRWVQKGKKARITKNGDHMRMNVCGTVCPRTGQFYALEFNHSNRAAFQAFLDHASRDITFQRGRNILIVDNASWHKSQTLDWGAFEPLFLPPYSPDLNPIERLWLIIKAEWFTDFIAKNMEMLIDRLDKALLWAMGREESNQKTCTIKKEL